MGRIFFLTIWLMQDTYRLRQWHMCIRPPSIIIGVGVGQNGSLTKCILKPTRKRESNCYFPSPDPGTSICCLDMILLLFDFLQFDLLNCAKSNPASQVWILFNTGEGILPSLPRGPKIKTTKTPVQKIHKVQTFGSIIVLPIKYGVGGDIQQSSPWALESTAFSANALNKVQRHSVLLCADREPRVSKGDLSVAFLMALAVISGLRDGAQARFLQQVRITSKFP